MNQTASVLERFARVHGSGIFHIDDFCALTGCPPLKAAHLLRKAERASQRVLAIAPAMYILKPSAPDNRPVCYDWRFNPGTQQLIFRACGQYPQHKSALMRLTGLADTTVSRYLRAMLRSGNLTCVRRGQVKYYSAGAFRPLTTYRAELCPKGA